MLSFFLIALVEKTVMIFFVDRLACVARRGGYKGCLCCEEERLCLQDSAPPFRCLAAAHFVAALFGLKRAARGADAIIKLTHGRDGTHCPRTAALPPHRDAKCPHLRRNGENKSVF